MLSDDAIKGRRERAIFMSGPFYEDPRIFSEICDRLLASEARVKVLEDALRWYGEQARLAKLIHSEGDSGRNALAKDGGNRARKALEEGK